MSALNSVLVSAVNPGTAEFLRGTDPSQGTREFSVVLSAPLPLSAFTLVVSESKQPELQDFSHRVAPPVIEAHALRVTSFDDRSRRCAHKSVSPETAPLINRDKIR